VGVTGGAGALFATMGALGLAPTAAAAAPEFRAPSRSDFTLTGRSAKRVVILGGGIAGLTTAGELGKAGYHCTILEARGRTGLRGHLPERRTGHAAVPDGPDTHNLGTDAGRVYFAGDWLSHAVAWQHHAFVSARATVTALHSRVMSGG